MEKCVLLATPGLKTFFTIGILTVLLACVSNRTLSQPSAEIMKQTPSVLPSAPIHLELSANTSSVVMNFGSSIDPILPMDYLGPCAKTIAFEPISHCSIPNHPQVLVVPVAVSDEYRLSVMHVLNKAGVSSSLFEPGQSDFWNEGYSEKKIVPVIPLSAAILSVPLDVSIELVLTDMQGGDFAAVSSAISAFLLRKVKFVRTEVWFNNVATYQGVQNDFCQDWVPFMSSHGYRILSASRAGETINADQVKNFCDEQVYIKKTFGLDEGDADWILPTEFPTEFDFNNLKRVQNKEYREYSSFTDDDYRKCS